MHRMAYTLALRSADAVENTAAPLSALLPEKVVSVTTNFAASLRWRAPPSEKAKFELSTECTISATLRCAYVPITSCRRGALARAASDCSRCRQRNSGAHQCSAIDSLVREESGIVDERTRVVVHKSTAHRLRLVQACCCSTGRAVWMSVLVIA